MSQERKHERIPQLQEVKSGEIKKLDLPGINITAIEFNTSGDPVAITFGAADSRVLKVTGYSTYDARIRVFIEKPPEIETRYQLTGELGPDVFHEKTFKKREDAERKMKQLTENFQNARNLIITEKREEV